MATKRNKPRRDNKRSRRRRDKPEQPDDRTPLQEINLRREMRRIKRKRRVKQREFIQAVLRNRPNVDTEKLLQEFDQISKSATGRLVRLTMRCLAFVSAASYATEELNNQGATDMDFDLPEVEGFSRRLLRIQVLRMLLRTFRLPVEIRQQILNLQIVRDFGGGAAPMRLPMPLPPNLTESRKPYERPQKPNPFVRTQRSPPAAGAVGIHRPRPQPPHRPGG